MKLDNNGIVAILEEVKAFLEREVTSKVWFQVFKPKLVYDLYTDIDQSLQGEDWTYRVEIEHPVVKLMSYAYQEPPDFGDPENLSDSQQQWLIEWASQHSKELAQSTQIVVRFTNYQSKRVGPETETTVDIALELVSWNAGLHANEVYYPTGQKAPEPDKNLSISSEIFETRPDVQYIETGDGWADVLHLATMVRTALIDCGPQLTGNLRFNEEDGISIAPLGDAQGIWNTDPFFIVTMNFGVTSYSTNRKHFDREGL